MIDTKSFMDGAYTVATLIYLAYIVSLWNRARRVSSRLAVLVEGTGVRVDRDPAPRS